MNSEKGDILRNFEKFLKHQCEKHFNRITYFCTAQDCITNKKHLLCIECFGIHTKEHAIIPSYDLFSYNLLDDIKKSIKLEEEELSSSYQSKVLTLEQVDEIYDQIQVDLIDYLIKILHDSKANLIQRLERDEFKGYPQKLHQEFEEILTRVFSKPYDNINVEDIEKYSRTYSKIFNDLKNFKINYVGLINEQIVEANKKINDLLLESSKLRMAFEDFEKKLAPDYAPSKVMKAFKDTELKNSIQADSYIIPTEEIKESPTFSSADANVKVVRNVYNLYQLKEAIKANETSVYIHTWGTGDDVIAKEIGTELAEAQQLVSLDIGFGNKMLSNKGVKSICTGLEKCQNLKSLKLLFANGKNKINNEGAKSIAAALSHLTNLTHLGLLLGGGSNQITDEGLVDIAKSLEQIKSLTYLDISFGGGSNKITDEGLKSLSQSLISLSELKILKLWFWNETKGSSSSINNIINNKITASFLNTHAGQNLITNEGIKSLSVALGKLLNLSVLLLSFESSNKFTEDCLKQLGDALGSLPVLDNVWINMEKGWNKISEVAKASLEEACSKCKERKIFI